MRDGKSVYDDCCLDELSDVDSYAGSLSEDKLTVEEEEEESVDEDEELII